MDNKKRDKTIAFYTIIISISFLIFLIVWGTLGKIARKVSGEGILTNGGGSAIIYAPSDGVITDVPIYRDMSVSKYDTLARLETQSGEIIRIYAPSDGRIVNLDVTENKPVRTGDVIGSILMYTDNTDLLTAVCYLPLSDAGRITPGMEMEIYPQGINTDETGHMNALVSVLSGYPATKMELLHDIGSAEIADSFLDKSPIITVKGALLKDQNAKNAYRWSNPKGGDVNIVDGMLINVTVIVGYKSPFVLFLPFLKNVIFGGS